MPETVSEQEKLRATNTLGEIVRFGRESTGAAIALAYLVLIISSMAYLVVFFGQFNIDILKLVALEDILVTPIRNPDIIVAIVAIGVAVLANDALGRYNDRLNHKYLEKEKPWYVKVSQRTFFYFPRTDKGYYRMTAGMFVVFLSFYIYLFADAEAEYVLQGKGYEVMLALSGEKNSVQVTLLGTTSLYVIVYDRRLGQSYVHQVESVTSITPYAEPKKEQT